MQARIHGPVVNAFLADRDVMFGFSAIQVHRPRKPLGRLEQVHLLLQAFRYFHRAAVVPERRVVALRRVVVQHQEVADLVDLEVRLAIELVDIVLVEIAVREQVEQLRDAGLDQVDAG